MIEDDSFQADGKPEGVLYGFLTQGANIQRGGRFVGQIVGVEAACDNGPAISALGNNFNSSGEEGGGAVSVVNGAAGPGLDAESRGGAGIFGKGATNGVHGQTSSPNDSGVWGENTGHGFGAAGSSSAIGVFGGLPGSQGLLGKPSTAVGLWGTTVTLQYPSDNGDGVLGEGKNGVHGRSRSPMDSGVYGENTGGGTGVAGLTNGENGPKGTVAGVWGVNQGAGAGVRGTGGKTGVLGECNGRLGSNGVHGFGAAEGSGVRGTGGVYGVIGEGQ